MAEFDKGKTVSLQELMVSTLTMTDALSKLLIEKASSWMGSSNRRYWQERAVYQHILNPTTQ
jgi:hypothetical protein